MTIQVHTSLMSGGLDLVTPPIAMPPGKVISAINYEPDVAGYTSMGGYERFDGHPRPSDSTDPVEIAIRRSSINEIPGTGPVRGVVVFDGSVYAFRDQDENFAGMFKSGVGGWAPQTFGHEIGFSSATLEFVRGETIVGQTSAAVATVERVVLRSGAWDGTGEGYLIVSEISGTFVSEEILGASTGAVADAEPPLAITITAGGQYDFTIHNFYGSGRAPCLYFANGVGTAFEWSGTVLSPIYTGVTEGEVGTYDYLLGYLVQTPTLTIASPCVATVTAHGYNAGQSIMFVTTGALPTGITAGTTYYVIATGLTANTFQFSATLAGAAVNTSGSQSGVHSVARTDLSVGDFILAWDGSSIVLAAFFDAPSFVEHFKNHLFLAFSSGALLNSSIGEPLEFITTTGAGEISFGDRVTGIVTAAATSLVIAGQNRFGYITGDDASTFVLIPLSSSSGAQPYSLQMMDEPLFLDDGGVRRLAAVAAFGDWSLGTLTQPIEPLVFQKRDNAVVAVASLKVRAKNQYRLFWSDGSGITVYLGRKNPETLPFNLPISIFCAASGEVDDGLGDRLFVGSATDGFVYELNRGTSFDGENIRTYIRLPFTAAGSPAQDTRWTKATFELATPDDIDVGVAFDVDYARGLGGSQVDIDLDAGSAIVTTDHYGDIDWMQPVQGRLEFHLSGIGPNIAATLITEAADKRPHTLSSQTYNFSRRRLRR